MNSKHSKKTKSTGFIEVIESAYGRFYTNDVSAFVLRNVLFLQGHLQITDREMLSVILTVDFVHGASSGVFLPDEQLVPYALIRRRQDDNLTDHNAKSGSYKMIYEPEDQHMTGNAQFFSPVNGVDQESKFNFDIKRFTF